LKSSLNSSSTKNWIPSATACALERIEQAVRRPNLHEDEKARIASLVELCFAYERESDADERRISCGRWKNQ